ncbi:hypothetical protein ABVT39_013273 [Epinephelus coioides]
MAELTTVAALYLLWTSDLAQFEDLLALDINADWMLRHSVTQCNFKSSNFSTSSNTRDEAMEVSSLHRTALIT